MTKVRNVLFIMCDQLRADYLGCNGHPFIKTANIDWLATKGVNFTKAYAQAPVCGPSRMSFYTGRYVSSHGATWNRSPLRVDELTLGHAMMAQGLRAALVGKSHIVVDTDALARLGMDPLEDRGRLIAEGGFEPVERDDGVHRDARVAPDLAYNEFLREHGYGGHNPWHSHANSADGENGEVLSGWHLRNSGKPARVAEAHSETAYMTDRALDFIKAQGDEPWFLHLSYIKPHWPYMAPAHYHSLYSRDHVIPARKGDIERSAPHAIARVLMDISDSVAFQNEQTRETVIPTYMGLVHQIDDHLGRVFDLLNRTGRMNDTMIVFTSDHGDHLGDHWLADKGMFYESAVRIPLIIYDPRKSADSMRGCAVDTLVESIDLFPTFAEATGGAVPRHRLEGESLLPILDGDATDTARSAVFSEMDYAFIETRSRLNLGVDRATGRMVRTRHWKYVHFDELEPQLFDLNADPDEICDLGTDQAYAHVREEMQRLLMDWSLRWKTRITVDHENVASWLSTGRESGVSKAAW
ncbi:MAG: sulfatase-like hydrolase/transferase [Boseongicola sp. SB0662_bin_57]|nr:sulfatase-like hydrolase/transferase [Boseongicola sp. SB0662_bin_57]